MKSVAKKVFLTILIVMMLIGSSFMMMARACEGYPGGLILNGLPSGVYAEVSYGTTPPTFYFGDEESPSLQLQSYTTVLPTSITLPVLPNIRSFYFSVLLYGASFSGKVEVGVPYDPTGLTLRQQQKLRLYMGDPVDFNGDGTVNGKDIALMQCAIRSRTYNPMFDINHDGLINKADLRIVKEFAEERPHSKSRTLLLKSSKTFIYRHNNPSRHS